MLTRTLLLFTCFIGKVLSETVQTYPGGELLAQIEPSSSAEESTKDLGLLEPVSKALSADAADGNERRSAKIPNTLMDRARYCPNPAYGLCPGGRRCCPLGGWCCYAGDCCRSGTHCCSDGGCCKNSHYCVVVNGYKGCCPNGRICSRKAGKCADTGYTACDGESFCCRAGDVCSRDSAGKPICSPAGNTPATLLASSTSDDTTVLGASATASTSSESVLESSTISAAESTESDAEAKGVHINVSAATTVLPMWGGVLAGSLILVLQSLAQSM